ncbi:MAG TPA: F0F1 ATP synthase subunit epsilon [Streptosporangiaceae bacterium]|nr:F0F1 ATP synthase subunit epsilon [Streptosporangiaceae bacterium]
MTLQVKLVVPEGEVWTGQADRIVAKTLDGEIGILTGHTPVLGILSPGSVVRILPAEAAAGGWVQAAVGTGFLSVAADRVSVLARDAILGADVDKATVRAELQTAVGEAQSASSGQGSSGQGSSGQGSSGQSAELARANYLRAQLRAAGEEV